MQRIVFGLKDVYNAQCANAGIGLTSSALELNIPGLNYGYIAGGQDPVVSDIIRLDFTTDTASDTGNNMSRALTGCMGNGISSPNYGYFGGGYTPGGAGHVCYIDRLDFSNETSAQLGSSMTQRRGNMAGTQTQDYGYLAGGFIPPTPAGYSTIDRVDFSTETVTNLPATLPQSRLNLNRVTSSSYGYFIGGQNPGLTCRIDRIDFSVETTSVPGNNVPVAYTAPMGNTQSQDYGYFAGGSGPSTHTSDIFRIDFSDDTLSVPSANLSLARGDGSGVSSPSHGYWCGGYTGAYQDNIDKFEFNTETQSNPGNMPANRMGQFGVQVNRPQVFKYVPGNSLWKESPNHGYFCGGYSTTSINTMDRIDFSSETTSAPGNNLIQAGNAAGGIQNTNYAYLGGGQGNGNWSTISRLEFQTDTIVNPPAKQTFTAGASAGISAKDKGYFAGNGSGSPDSCTVDRLDFTTETVTANTPIGQPKREPVGTQTEDYGYCVGGRSNQLGIDWSTINRVDFATDIFSTIPSTLPQGRRNKAAVQNTKYAYFCLGGNSGVCTVDRMDFSTETVTEAASFGPARWYPGGASSFSYGYIAGGGDAVAVNVSIINRLDFDTETASTSSSTLNLAKRLMPGVSGGVSTRRVSHNSPYGYFGGGYGPNLRRSTIDRLDLATETILNPAAALSETTQNCSSFTSGVGGAGYFIGGRRTATRTCIIDRLDYSNETVSNPSQQLLREQQRGVNTSHGTYGYIAQGDTPSPEFACALDRFDFTTETLSPTSTTMLADRQGGNAVQSSTAGYYAGGGNSVTIDKLEFATETMSVNAGSLTDARGNMGSTYNNNYGYFAGGFPGLSCVIDRLDFATDSVAATPGQLSDARWLLGGTGNQQYGYFGGGAPGSKSMIDRLDFNAETVSTISQSLSIGRQQVDGLTMHQ